MTDAEKAERLARVLWLAYWDGQPPYEWDAEPGRATDWRNTATAALTWLDSLEDGPALLRAERDALRAEVERLRDICGTALSVQRRIQADTYWRTPDNTLWPDLSSSTDALVAALEAPSAQP